MPTSQVILNKKASMNNQGGYAIVDVDDEVGDISGQGGGNNNLEFQTFLGSDSAGIAHQGRQSPANRGDPATVPFNPFNLSYYQHYFDIDTATVLKRVMNGMIPRPGGGFVEGICEERVDLYGPFWTLTTLILSIFLSASLSSSISRYLSQPEASDVTSSDITLLSLSTSLIYAYGLGFPSAFWAVTKYISNRTRGNEGAENGDADVGAGWGIVEAIGVWGYGMGVWVPVSILCVIPIPILRWILVGGATASSGYFLVENIYPILRQARSNKIPQAMMLIVLVVHVGIALAMKVLFFSYTVAGKTIGPDDPIESPIEEVARAFVRSMS